MKTIEETYRERLKMLINEFGGQAKLSEVINKSPAQISQWLNGSPDSKTGKPRSLKSETAREIEEATGKPRAWFDQPVINAENIQLANNYGGNQNNTQYNMYRQNDQQAASALIPEEQAEFLKAMPLLDISDGLRYVLSGAALEEFQNARDKIATFISHSDKSFGIKMADDSMTIPDAAADETIFKGDILVIEPLMKPRDNDIVMVCLGYGSDPRPIIARLQIGIAGDYTINQPNRPDGYIPLPEDALICGVVIEIKRRIIEPDIVRARHDNGWKILNTLKSDS